LAALAAALVWATSMAAGLPQQLLVVAQVMAVQAQQILAVAALQGYLRGLPAQAALALSSFATQSKEKQWRTTQK